MSTSSAEPMPGLKVAFLYTAARRLDYALWILWGLENLPIYQENLWLDVKDSLVNTLPYQAQVLCGGKFSRTDPTSKDPTVSFADGAALRQALATDAALSIDRHIAELIGSRGMLYIRGEEHTRVRGLFSPAFTPDEIEKYTPQVQELYSRNLQRAAADSAAGRPVQLHEVHRLFTFEVICRLVVGLDLSESELQAVLADYGELLSVTALTALWWRPPLLLDLMKLPFMPLGRSMAAKARLQTRILAVITEARQLVERGGTATSKGVLFEIIESGVRDPSLHLSDEELVDNMLLFLLAGFDTTASLLTSLVYFTAKEPAAWQAVVEEQAQLQRQFGATLNSKVLRQMPVTEAFVRETLRLKTPIVQLARMTTEEVVIGEYRVPAGWKVNLFLQHLNAYDPAVTKEGDGQLDPLVFNPGRFLGVKPGATMQLPFSAGKHNCLGQSLAMMEAKVGAAVLARGFSVQLAEEPAYWMSTVGQVPSNGLPVQVTPLSASSKA